MELLDRVAIGRDRRNSAGGVQPPVQFHFLIDGEIEEVLLRSGWQTMAERLSRANGSSERVNENGNGTGSKARQAPWQKHDLRTLRRDEARTWIRSFLETDGQQGISSERFPAMRCALIAIKEREHELVWSLHPALREHVDVEHAVDDLINACQFEARVHKLAGERAEEPEDQANNPQLTGASQGAK